MAVPPPLSTERSGQMASRALVLSRQRLADALSSNQGCDRQFSVAMGGTRSLRFGAQGERRATVVHFHGGGFRQGQPEMLAAYASALAQGAKVAVWCPAYRLAPEHPFPAALNDGLRMIAALVDGGAERLVLAGDSAGGGLAASLALVCAMHGVKVSGVVLHSPWLDLTVSNPCYLNNGESDPLFSQVAAVEARELYLQGHPASDPLVSPLCGDLSRFPPTMLSVGSGEVLLGDALSLHERLQTQGREVQLCQVNGMDHIAVTRGLDLVGSRQTLSATIEFVSRIC